MITLKILGKLTRWLWLALAAVVIGYAVIVVLGRYMLPSLDSYRPRITSQLSQLLGAEVQMERLSGTWPRFAPTLSADNVTIAAVGGGDIDVRRVSAELDPFASLWRRQFIWRRLNLSEVTVQLTEDSQGGWSVAGFPLGKGGQGVKPLEMLFYSSLIEVDRVELRLNFYSGATLGVKAEDILVENSGDFHRILANLAAGEGQLATFVFEATGDYSDPGDFEAAGYLQLERLNLALFDSVFGRILPPAYAAKLKALDGAVETRLWFDMAADGSTQMVGQLNAEQLPLGKAMALPAVTDLSADLMAWYQPGADWGMRLQGLQFHWGYDPVAPLDIQFRQRVGDRWGEFSVNMTRLSIGALGQLALHSQLLPEQLHREIVGLNPVGSAEQIRVDVSLSEQGPPAVELKARLRDAGMNGYRGAPAASGLDGYLETSVDSGMLVLDSQDASLHFTGLFNQPLALQRVTGTLSWLWDRQRDEVSLVSSPLQANTEAGDVKGQFYLHIPIKSKRPDDPPELFLQMGVRDSHSRYRDRFIPKILNPKLLDWLDRAIGDTEIQQAGIMFRGSLRKGQRARRTLQLYVKGSGERLKYHPEWPSLDNYHGELLYRAGKLRADIHSGALGGLEVAGAVLEMDALGDQLLSLRASGSTVAPEAVQLLRSTPLGDRLAGLEEWQVAGDISATAELHIPLQADWRTGQYRVVANIDNGQMRQADYQLAIEDIGGAINYSLQGGLSADRLSGRLWDTPVTASLATVDDQLQFDVSGALQADKLTDNFGVPRELLNGESAMRARVRLAGKDSNEPSRVTLESDLRGIEVALPPPFGKQADQAKPLKATLTLADSAVIDLHYGNHVRAGGEWLGQQLRRGYLGINRSDLQLPEGSSLLLAADVSDIDLADWQSSLQPLFNRQSAPGLTALPPLEFDVRVGELDISQLALSRVHLAGNISDAAVRAELDSNIAAGRLQIPLDSNQPITIALDNLELPEWRQDESDAGGLDPRNLRDMLVSVQQLSLAERLMGTAAFALRSDDNGLRISAIDAELLGLQIGGAGEQPAGGAELSWTVDGDQHQTRFVGQVQTGDIAGVLVNFGLEAVMQSEDAVARGDLQWQGKPWQFGRDNLAGEVVFNLRKGNIYQSTGGAANAFMRVVGLFNFSNWVRRLRLDFSDVFKKGISYDRLSGSLIFDRGTLNFPEPIAAKAPSGAMQMRGRVDLLEEQVDAQLTATLPVGTNLPWVAALAVNLPAAAGAWVISKVFKRQVNKLSSISYKIDGSLEDPDISIEKIFSD